MRRGCAPTTRKPRWPGTGGLVNARVPNADYRAARFPSGITKWARVRRQESRQDGRVEARAVFVFEDRDVSAYPSVPAAEGDIEVYDINRFAIFADDGMVFAAETDQYKVRLRPTAESRPDELRSRLRSYLSDPGVNLDPSLADSPRALAQVLIDREWAVRPFRWFPWLDRRVNGAEPPRVVEQ